MENEWRADKSWKITQRIIVAYRTLTVSTLQIILFSIAILPFKPYFCGEIFPKSVKY